MSWPTVVLVLGCLAFVAVLVALAVCLIAIVSWKDLGALNAWQQNATPAPGNTTATGRYGPQRIA